MAKQRAKGSMRATFVAKPARTRNRKTGLWTNREAVPGQFKDVKESGGTLKRIRRED